MRRASLAVFALLIVAGCDGYTSPSGGLTTWALVRIGPDRLPVPIGGGGAPPLLLADTLRYPPAGYTLPDLNVLTHTEVMKDANGQTARSESRHNYTITKDVFSYDPCPWGALCLASLVYAPRSFQMVGDSLFQIIPVAGGANIQPYVYGRVRR